MLQSEEATILSDRGTVSTDERTNTLLINDTAEHLVAIRTLVGKLDIPVRQVLIESRVVVASDDFNKEIGKLPFGGFLELELSAMEAEGRGEIVSSPRVITANQKEAYIQQGVEVPYLEASASGAASIAFKEATLGMKVTPQITPDDRIIMDLTVTKDSVGQFFGSGVARVPSIDTREVNTQVLVENGETVVLGGIYEQVRNTDTRRVPILGNLPVVGRLFRHDASVDEKNELLIFVTPKIIGNNTSVN